MDLATDLHILFKPQFTHGKLGTRTIFGFMAVSIDKAYVSLFFVSLNVETFIHERHELW